jgi:hypothetical protein
MFERVINQADHDFEKHLQRLQRYIQQPSVSAENRGIERWLSCSVVHTWRVGNAQALRCEKRTRR